MQIVCAAPCWPPGPLLALEFSFNLNLTIKRQSWIVCLSVGVPLAPAGGFRLSVKLKKLCLQA